MSVRESKGRCPRCGSRELAEVVYGSPNDAQLRRLWAERRIMIRARHEGEKLPGWTCRECGLEWSEAREAYGSAPRPI